MGKGDKVTKDIKPRKPRKPKFRPYKDEYFKVLGQQYEKIIIVPQLRKCNTNVKDVINKLIDLKSEIENVCKEKGKN